MLQRYLITEKSTGKHTYPYALCESHGSFLLVSAPLGAEGAPQTEDINGSLQITRTGAQASHLAEIRDVHF